jgi:hypothetical protein
MKIAAIKRAVACAFIFLLATFAASNLSESKADANRLSEFLISQTEKSPPAQQPQPQAQAQPDKKAEEVYKNIQILKGIPASRLLGAMNFFARSLGVKCDHCHIPNPTEFHKDEKPTKLTARKMYHEPVPAAVQAEVDEMMGDDARPAERVFKNIQSLKGVPAGRIMGIMTAFSKSLGVECSHCHDEAAFEKDDIPHKQKARQMIAMVGSITKEFYQGQMTVNCYTCHRGQAQPVSMPPRPDAQKPDPQKKDGN